MIQKLKRITSEADHHKVLDLAYLAAIVIGIFQFTDSMKAIVDNQGTLSLYLLAFQMIVMCVCGSLGYYWHVKGMVLKEAMIVAPIITGFLTLISFSAIVMVNTPVKNPFLVNLGGLSITIALWFIIELSERLYKIHLRKRQLRVSRTARVKAGTPLDNEIIEKKASEISGLLNNIEG
jgi:hypothetical protein